MDGKLRREVAQLQKSHLNLLTIKVILETSTFVYTCYSFSTLAEQNFSYFLPKPDKKNYIFLQNLLFL